MVTVEHPEVGISLGKEKVWMARRDVTVTPRGLSDRHTRPRCPKVAPEGSRVLAWRVEAARD